MTLRVLFAPETIHLGETARAVEVAKALEPAGHEIRFMGYSRRFAHTVRSAGFDLQVLSPALSDAAATRRVAAERTGTMRYPASPEMLRLRVASELDLMDTFQPQVVVSGSSLSMLLAARAADVPLVSIRPYALSRSHLRSTSQLPALAGTGKMAGVVNRGAAVVSRVVARRLRWKPRAFQDVAKRYGVPLPDLALDAIDADLNLIASLFPALDGRQLSERELAVGPIYARSAMRLPPRVTELRESGKPIVYVGMGSSVDRKLVFNLLCEISRLEVEVLSSTGSHLSRHDRNSLPANVQLHDFLPAHRLAGIIDAAVIHGGEGTVQTACASGVPFAGIGMQLEQRHNIEECVAYGNALRFTRRSVNRGQLPGMVQQLLDDATLRGRATRIQAEMARLDGPATAARAITDLVS